MAFFNFLKLKTTSETLRDDILHVETFQLSTSIDGLVEDADVIMFKRVLKVLFAFCLDQVPLDCGLVDDSKP